MATLLLRLVAPMQAWGSRSFFDDRDTEAEPTRSGVLGLCAAAMGIDRHERIDELLALQYGVRVDREGSVGRDYHTAQLHPHHPKTRTDVTIRAYLADAAFWVGLQGDGDVLSKLYLALQRPHWPLCLGRKSFVASLPLFADPPLELSLWDALHAVPSLRRPPAATFAPALMTPERTAQPEAPYRFVLDKEAVPAALQASASPSRRQDVPAGPFAQRRYHSREVLTLSEFLQLPTDPLLLRQHSPSKEVKV